MMSREDVPRLQNAPRTTTPSPMDDTGRPERETATLEPPLYGEPHGPRPPHFETRDKAEIDERARRHAPSATHRDRWAGAGDESRVRGGFASGMDTPEAFEVAGDRPPRVARLDPGEEGGDERRD